MRLMFTWVLGRYVAVTVLYPNLLEAADRVGGQLHGDNECPLSGVTKSGSLEEGAGKRCWESGEGVEGRRTGLSDNEESAPPPASHSS